MQAAESRVAPLRPAVRCACRQVIFDGLVIKSRVVRLLPDGAQAKCRQCRAWVRVPCTYKPLT